MTKHKRPANVVAVLVFITFVVVVALGTTTLFFGSSKVGVLFQDSADALAGDGGTR